MNLVSPSIQLIGTEKKHCDPIIIEEAFFADLDETLNNILPDEDDPVHSRQRSCHLFVFVHGF